MKPHCNHCHDTGLMGGYGDYYSTPCDECEQKPAGIAWYVIAAFVIAAVVAIVGRVA